MPYVDKGLEIVKKLLYNENNLMKCKCLHEILHEKCTKL
jgi:hypothetical protein